MPKLRGQYIQLGVPLDIVFDPEIRIKIPVETFRNEQTLRMKHIDCLSPFFMFSSANDCALNHTDNQIVCWHLLLLFQNFFMFFIYLMFEHLRVTKRFCSVVKKRRAPGTRLKSICWQQYEDSSSIFYVFADIFLPYFSVALHIWFLCTCTYFQCIQ